MLLEKFREEMSLLFSLDDLSRPFVSPGYFSSEKDMDVDVGSSAGSDCSSHNIQVLACYRNLPVNTQPTVAEYPMTTDLPDLLEQEIANFDWGEPKWDQEYHQPHEDMFRVGAGLSTYNYTTECPIDKCADLTPLLDSISSIVNSHIQGISVRVSGRCGEPHAVEYGQCSVWKNVRTDQRNCRFNFFGVNLATR